MIGEDTSAREMEEVLLGNLLGGRTSVERRDNGVERHTRASDTHDAIGVQVNRNDWTTEDLSDPSALRAAVFDPALHGGA